ncbi:type II toxin-antitoxin system RelE/ParE family toxin [Kaistella antarctica]|uniref:Plasmid stabilisation system protein n=1 Tax=Kaistella antarctica TaxID=266748 RepID=A0A3S4UR05_9FLAO|nr:type II toxin-antitoxin system RelE/ParE family toxin [Kaistella antarctica]KEY19553.1 hypothetical protein HY04_14270 [Kaistella antarctica]SEW08290.1 ParE toxin of type II toxin-antitoxin system, parDE [Kaistella antarctica]VEH97148.1 Plasmid stabilisation system protein [Kaistella antarctica]
MDFRVQITLVAKTNQKQAVAYYKEKATLKVAQNFLKDYEKTLYKIKQNPYYQIYYKNFRGLPLKKFPYIVFYTIDENLKVITIKAIFHTSQNPGKYP